MLYLRMLIYYYTFTHGHARTAHGHARTCTDIGLCAPRTARTRHGHATDISCGPFPTNAKHSNGNARSQWTQNKAMAMRVHWERSRGSPVLKEHNMQYWLFAFVENALTALEFSANAHGHYCKLRPLRTLPRRFRSPETECTLFIHGKHTRHGSC